MEEQEEVEEERMERKEDEADQNTENFPASSRFPRLSWHWVAGLRHGEPHRTRQVTWVTIIFNRIAVN
jgi:hypothetical protein